MGRTVTHLITGLGKGGAETMLYQVLKYRTDRKTAHRVVSLGGARYYEGPIQALGIPVAELPLRTRPVSSLLRLPKLLRGSDTLCCWMYHANFLGYPAAKLARVPRVVWCVHHADLSPARNHRTTLWLNRICAGWSSHVDIIAYTGELARTVHEAAGYCGERGQVLQNGCDITEYTPNAQAREDLCQELRLDNRKQIICSVTKDTPIKDTPTFLQAFGALHRERPETAAVLCGSGIEPENQRLVAQCAQEHLKIGQDIFLLGLRHDVPRLLAACDLYVLHSAGEAFPVTLLQAMSCGCLCVATDVGDVRRILVEEEWLVPPRNAEALAEKMGELLLLSEKSAQTLRDQNRKIAQEKYDIRKIVRHYEALF